MTELEIDDIHLCPICNGAVRKSQTVEIVGNGAFAMLAHLDCATDFRLRPKAPEVEWDKDLPDIGAEKQYYNSEMNEVRECTVIAHRHGCAVVEDQDGQTYEAVPPNSFIRTKEQRQRDALEKLLDSNRFVRGGFSSRPDVVADAIIDAGWKKDD